MPFQLLISFSRHHAHFGYAALMRGSPRGCSSLIAWGAAAVAAYFRYPYRPNWSVLPAVSAAQIVAKIAVLAARYSSLY